MRGEWFTGIIVTFQSWKGADKVLLPDSIKTVAQAHSGEASQIEKSVHASSW